MVPFDTVHVWEVNGGKPLATLAHTDPIDWDALKARLEATVPARFSGARFTTMRFAGSVKILAIAPSGRRVATYREADQTLRLWDTESARVTNHEVLEKQPYLHFLSETTLLRTDEPGTLSIRQLPAGNALWSKDLGNIKTLAVTRNADRIATLSKGAADVLLRVWDVATGNAILERTIDSAAGGLHFDASGRYLTVTSHFGAQAPLIGLPPAIALAVWDIAARRTVVSRPREATTIAFSYSHDGSQFATVGSNGEVHVWDLSTGASRPTVTADPGPVAFSANGRWLAVGLHSLRVLDAATLNPVAQLDIGGEIRAIEFQTDDTIVTALRVENGGRIGLVERHHWRTDDKIAEACSRIPLETAQRQWRQLLPAQAVPTPCEEPAPGLLSRQR
jgi:WD40 repeat protein